MLSAVLDTNVIVSANLRPDGRQAQILLLALSGVFRMCASEEILEEYEEVLCRDRFHLPPDKIRSVMREIRDSALVVRPGNRVTVSPDADDNKFLECALEAKAGYVVTGNIRDYPREFRKVLTVSPAEFQSILTRSFS